MKVYVVKNDKGQYMTETKDFINSLWQAELFDDLETACCYTPNDCNVVECALMTPTEFQDYIKQARKEVVQEIKKKLVQMGRWDMQENGSIYFKMNINTLNDILDKFEQGE